MNELEYLKNLPNLTVLWLWDNPCAEQADYRAQVISVLPNLVKLDNQPVGPEEKNGRPPAQPRQEERQEPRNNYVAEERAPERRPAPAQKREAPRENNAARNDNILCAVLALLKELDQSGLELVARDIERKLRNN